MKTLVLMRHAKSSWDDSTMADFDRPLAPRGERDAPRIGRAIGGRGSTLDLVVSSPAVRARQTAETVIRSGSLAGELRFDERIYDASAPELFKLIRELPRTCSSVMIVGHNPGLESLFARLTGISERMPTAAVACIELKVDEWDEVEDAVGNLTWMMTPKSLSE
jgi:phosphohistidine phosphatase